MNSTVKRPSLTTNADVLLLHHWASRWWWDPLLGWLPMVVQCFYRCIVGYTEWTAQWIPMFTQDSDATTKWRRPNMVSRGRYRTEPDSPNIQDCFLVSLVTGKWNSWTMFMLYSSADIFQGRWSQNEGWCVAWILELWSGLVFPDWRHTAILNWAINEGTTTEEWDECKMLLWDWTLGADVLVSSVLQKQTG